MGQFYLVYSRGSVYRLTEQSTLPISQIATETWDCLLRHLLMHLCTKQGSCSKHALALLLFLLYFDSLASVLWQSSRLMGKYYDPVVCCQLSNKVMKHQNWLASCQKLFSKLLVEGQQVATLAGGIVDKWGNLGTLMRASDLQFRFHHCYLYLSVAYSLGCEKCRV